jgi:Hydrazine synthase alpha subunit middle domain
MKISCSLPNIAFILLVALNLVCPQLLAAQCSNPIMFVTQVPNPRDFGTTPATFGNHLASMDAAYRGGDLYIRYPDGSLKNLTQAAGFGNDGAQRDSAIAVRDPAVHWSGTKALFSMVLGAPTERYQVKTFYWQLYEVTGLGQSDTPVITKVPNQPENYNNIMPAYATDDRIIFVTDRPRNGASHLYPQLDEYESFQTNTGLWSLNSATGDLFLLDHSPSGVFHPQIDSYGRVIYTRWDHLQRDQQNRPSQPSFEAFTWSSEAQNASITTEYTEIFPEPRDEDEPDYSPHINLHSFNHFFPWTINQDGTDHETLGHIGRQELHSYIESSFLNDPALETFYGQYSSPNQNTKILNLFHISESQHSPGLYFGVDAPEFGTHTAGQIVTLNGPPGISGDDMLTTYITHPDTGTADDTPEATHSGLYRNPLQCQNGTILAVHSPATAQDTNIGTGEAPISLYTFRIKQLVKNGEYYTAGTPLTSGITKSVSWWSPDTAMTSSGTLWELQPVEVRARPVPHAATSHVPAPERSILSDLGISEDSLKSFLIDNNLALLIGRDVTSRDDLDKQQPFNLQIADSSTKSTSGTGKIYDIATLQFILGEQIRGYSGKGGRRVLPTFFSGISQFNPTSRGPTGSVAVESDGSWAAFLPARRALSWQLVDPQGTPVIRERYWVTFGRGEIRVCASCHGVNKADQMGRATNEHAPAALRSLLAFWKTLPPGGRAFQLSIKKRKPKGRSAKEGKQRWTLRVTSTDESTFNTTAVIQLRTNDSICKGSGKPITIDSSGNGSLQINLPLAKKIKSLTFSLMVDGVERAVQSLKVKGKGKASPQKVCKAFS